MSHTTSIKGIKITDAAILQAAVASLAKQGIRCSLLRDATPRAYYANQQGLGKADFVLQLGDASYDVGFYKQADGSYEPRTDFWGGSVAKVLGGVASEPEKTDQAKLGRLFQSYGVEAAVAKARRNGQTLTRTTGKNGEIILTIDA